jgi:broad specificity phosphatase PhoE
MPAKRIHFIRHAQSRHNALALTAPDDDVLRRDPGLRDAPLTELGQRQAQALAQEIAPLREIELVVVSPLTRAIQTTLAAFDGHPAPRLVEALHREHLDSWCDIGQPPAALARAFPMLDFGHLDDPWWHAVDGAEPYVQEPFETFDSRVAAFADWLRARPEGCVAVVGHGTFLRRLTGEGFANAQRRELAF